MTESKAPFTSFGDLNPDHDCPPLQLNIKLHHVGLRSLNGGSDSDFYKRQFNMNPIKTLKTDTTTLHFLEGDSLERGQPNKVWNIPGKNACVVLIEDLLVTESVNNGNQEPHRSFGHIAFNINDLEETCAELETNKVAFKKKPSEGRMRDIAFALDPNGYWIELCMRSQKAVSNFGNLKFNFSQIMFRITDPRVSIPFYKNVLGLSLVHLSSGSDFTNFFLTTTTKDEREQISDYSPDATSAKGREFFKTAFQPLIELCHNWGTEISPKKRENGTFTTYHDSNTDPKGFSHIAFVVDDIHELKSQLHKNGLDSKLVYADVPASRWGVSKDQLISLYDPDGYLILIVDKNSD